ncbi:Pyrrolo-quinoline quinone repeat [Flavobacteriaceae bacterium]
MKKIPIIGYCLMLNINPPLVKIISKEMEKSNRILLLAVKLVFICLLYSSATIAQTEFFNSKIQFSESQLKKFYSSFSVDSAQVYFNANDYYVHAYDKKTGGLNWSYNLESKTNTAPIPYQNNVIVSKYSSEYGDKCLQLNTKTGDTIQTLVLQSINTKPIFKENIMYCTGIDGGYGGAVIAYDLKKNNILWGKFIAHGVDKQPYYLKDKIIANAEEDNWFELDYNGKMVDTTCEYKTNLFVEDIKCVQNYIHRTHDNKGISQSFLQEYFEDYENLKVSSNNNYTFLLSDSKLMLLKDNLEIGKEINIDEIVTLPEKAINGYREILKIDDSTIWFFYKNLVVVYDYINYQTLKTIDVSSWRPHQVVLENTQLWLISENDGQLVGLELDPEKATMIEEKAKKLSEINKCNTTEIKKIQVTKRAKGKLMKTVKPQKK